MIWTKNMQKAVRIVEKELKATTILNRAGIVSVACNIVVVLAKKNLIKKEN